MSAWVRSGVLMGAPELLRELGADPVRLAREVGIDRAAFQDPEFPVPVSAVAAFFEKGAVASDCESFGLRLSLRQELSLFGPLWPLFRNAPTVGALLQDLVDYFPLHTGGALVGLEPAPQGVLVTYEPAAGVSASRRQLVELGSGILVAELRRWDPAWRPGEVFFRHGPPRDRSLHQQVFGARIAFNADRNAVFVDAALLSRPNPAADARLHADLASSLEPRRRSTAGVVRGRTETVVRSLLPFAPCDLSATARMLRMSPRTLQRRLADDGASFGMILDEVRADLATSYLRESDLSVAEVAEILQFSQTSALSRAFRRWRDVSPRQARAAGRPDAPVPTRSRVGSGRGRP